MKAFILQATVRLYPGDLGAIRGAELTCAVSLAAVRWEAWADRESLDVHGQGLSRPWYPGWI